MTQAHRPDTQPNGQPMNAREELRELIRAKTAGVNPSEVADAVTALFYDVADDWDEIDVAEMGEAPGSRALHQRWLVARIGRQVIQRIPDRTVPG